MLCFKFDLISALTPSSIAIPLTDAINTTLQHIKIMPTSKIIAKFSAYVLAYEERCALNPQRTILRSLHWLKINERIELEL